MEQEFYQFNFIRSEKNEAALYIIFFREMQIQADQGEKLEAMWTSKLHYYQTAYPEEAAEFNALLHGGLVPGWESSLPVNIMTFLLRV